MNDRTEKLEYTFADVETALCCWEHIAERQNEGDTHYRTLIEGRGTVSARNEMIRIGQLVNRAYNELPEDTRDGILCFDWEFIPAVMEELANPFDATEDDIQRAVSAASQ